MRGSISARFALLCLGMGALTGCATNYSPNEQSISEVPLQQARADVKQAFSAYNLSVFFIDDLMVVGTSNVRVDPAALKPDAKGWWFLDVFFPLGMCTIEWSPGNDGVYAHPRGDVDTGCGKPEYQTVDALVRLKKATQQAAVHERERFDDALEGYRAANPKPAISEEVRQFEVMATAAVREKRFVDAVNDYSQGLAVAPWWAQGQFNEALVLGQLTYYDQAIDHMQKYLALVPDAQNARAAQDQIYAWKGKQGTQQ